MTNVCRFCKVHFQTSNQEQHVCDDCLQEVKKTVIEDSKLKFELLEQALKDEICIERIAKAVFDIPSKNVGLGGEGSLADFFRKRRKTPSAD